MNAFTDKQRSLWLDDIVPALRSGEYEQGRGQLRHVDHMGNGVFTYCCLGVATRVLADKGLINARGAEEDLESGLFLSDEGQEILGVDCYGRGVLESVEAGKSGEFYKQSLTNLNDDGATTFAEIADRIETALKEDS